MFLDCSGERKVFRSCRRGHHLIPAAPTPLLERERRSAASATQRAELSAASAHGHRGRVGGVAGHVGAAPPPPRTSPPKPPPRHCCGSGASGSGVPIQTSNATLSGFFRVICPSSHLLPCARKTDPGTSRCRSAAVRPRDPRSPRGFCRPCLLPVSSEMVRFSGTGFQTCSSSPASPGALTG